MLQFFQNVVHELADMMFVGGVVAAVSIGTRRDALLRQCADLPILAIDEIKHADGIGWVEIWVRHDIGIKEPKVIPLS